MKTSEVRQLEKILKKDFSPNKNAFVVIDVINYDYIDYPALIDIRGRYGFEKKLSDQKIDIDQKHFNISYYENESIDFIRGAFFQEVYRNDLEDEKE